MKYLILKPSSLGDIIQALPILRLIKRHDPESEVYWWLATDWMTVLQDDPDLSGIYPFPRKRLGSLSAWREVGGSIAEMRAKQFDWVIDLQGLARSGIVAWLANGANTIGLDIYREGARCLYDHVVSRPEESEHAVDWYAKVLDKLGILLDWDFEWLPVHQSSAASVQEKWSPGEHAWIAICPGARWETKRWPAGHFQEVLRQLSAHYPDHRFAILGGKEDSSLGQALSEAAPGKCLDLTGRTNLTEMIEWIRLSQLLVTNDTGPMHVAAALQIPVVSLFGPTSPYSTGPYGQEEEALVVEDLPCRPCFKGQCHNDEPLACLLGITPDRVVNEVRRCLGTNSLAANI